MTFSHFCGAGYSLLGNGTNIMVNEDDSCFIYNSDVREYFFKTKMTDSQS